MKVTLMDKTFDIEDFEIIVKNTRDGNLVSSFTEVGDASVFEMVLDEAETKRLINTFSSAISYMNNSTCKCDGC